MFIQLAGLLFAGLALLHPGTTSAASLEKEWSLLVFSTHGAAQVRDADFYLADTQKPGWEQAERELTLQLKDAPFDGQKNHPRCKYPARYYWLGIQQTGTPWLPPEFCKELHEWVDLQQLNGIDLLFVSGYLSNPASTFGHTLLNIKTSRNDGFKPLETSVNFGAIIPENEGVLPYLYKGLFGGYLARFSDGDYAGNDQTYRTKEMRPIWRVQLNLSQQQQVFTTLLVAEQTNLKQDYLFLSDNCAWYMARLLELGVGTELDAPVDPVWYAPIELVHTLHRRNNPVNGQPLVASVSHEASQQQLLQARLESMPPAQQEDYALLTENPPRLVRPDGSPVQSIDALSAALTYWEIRNLATANSGFALQKDSILKARLALPAQARTVVSVHPPAAERIADSQPVSQYGVGLQYSRLGQAEVVLRMAPYEQSNMTLHAMGVGKELSVLNTQVRLNSDSASLEFIELIRVSSVSKADSTGLSPFGGRMAWGFHTGSKVLDTDPDYRQRREAGGLAGQDLYSDLKLGASTVSADGAWLIAAYGGLQLSTGQHAWVPRLELEGQYRLGVHRVMHTTIEYKNAYGEQGGLQRDPRVFLKNHVAWALNRNDRLMLGMWHSDLDTGVGFFVNSNY